MFNDQNSYRAIRKISPEIRVVMVNEGNLQFLLDAEILSQVGGMLVVNQSRNVNPSEVNIGDYLRVDNLNEIYPISPSYFHENFDVV